MDNVINNIAYLPTEDMLLRKETGIKAFTDNVVRKWFEIILLTIGEYNCGKSPIESSRIKIRYWGTLMVNSTSLRCWCRWVLGFPRNMVPKHLVNVIKESPPIKAIPANENIIRLDSTQIYIKCKKLRIFLSYNYDISGYSRSIF